MGAHCNCSVEEPNLEFTQLHAHGSLEAILNLMKMTQKTETGDGCGVMSGALNNSF